MLHRGKYFTSGFWVCFRNMYDAGLPEHEHKQSEFMLYAVLKNKTLGLENGSWESLTSGDHASGQNKYSNTENC